MASSGSDELVDVGIRDDPDVNPSSLRFSVGNLVTYKDEDRNAWTEGEVVKVAQRLVGPRTSIFIHYIVWPHTDDVDGTVWVNGDTDNEIRPRPDDLTPDPEHFHPFLTPPEDPLSYLYTGLTSNPFSSDGRNMAQEFMRSGGVGEARINPDGSILLNMRGRRMTQSTFEIPNQVCGVPGNAVVDFVKLFHTRRQLHSQAQRGMLDIVGTFQSAVPPERSLRQLAQAAKTSNEKMLQLGDALMIGFHGWPRNSTRACNCYRAAGMGCQEDELLSENAGIAVGNPEAMVASANVYFTYIQCTLMGRHLSDGVSFSSLLLYTIQVPGGMDLLHKMIWWTTNSVKRGWISPFALALAESIEGIGLNRNPLVDEEIKKLMNPLNQLGKSRVLEMHFEQLQEQGLAPRGDPSNETIELFRVKADEIFKDLSMSSDGVHIEYRQLQRPPFPIVVVALHLSKQTVIKVVRLPGALAISPFTQQSFEFAWLRIAFELHLGDRQGRRRIRPFEFTVVDTHGNREFASYLEEALRGSGTLVRRVSHDDLIQVSSRRWWGRRYRLISLGEIIREVETGTILPMPGILHATDTDSAGDVVSGAQRDLIQSNARHLLSSVGDDKDQCLQKANQLSRQGTRLFEAADYTAAVKCYSVVIQLLSHVVDPDRRTCQLIGTTLAVRAACYLELEENATNPEFRRLLAQNAKKDCTLALESSWASDVLPRNIMKELKFRRDKAAARYDVLMTDFVSVVPILFPDSTVNETDNTANESVQRGVFTAFSNRIDLGATWYFELLNGLITFLGGFLRLFVSMFSDAIARLARESFALIKRGRPVVAMIPHATAHATESFVLLQRGIIYFLNEFLGPFVGTASDAMASHATEAFVLVKRGLFYFVNGFLVRGSLSTFLGGITRLKWVAVFALLLDAMGYSPFGVERKMTKVVIGTMCFVLGLILNRIDLSEQRRQERNNRDTSYSVEGRRGPSVRRTTSNETIHHDPEQQRAHAQPRDDLNQDTIHDAIMEYGKIVHEHSLSKNAKDGCPICFRDFASELSHTHSVILPCGEHALCIECVCRLKKEADKAQTAPTCPLCRSPFDPQFVEDLAAQVIDVDQELALLIFKLPVGTDDRLNVARRLLWTNDFCVEKVIEALECMLDAQTSGALFRTTVDLTHQQKQAIYEKARWPVNKLQEQLKRLLEERRVTFETNSLLRIDNDIRQARTALAMARLKAREEIYTQLNSVGNMGAQQQGGDDDDGIIQIDFHGLHVNEMQEKFKEQVKPILPVIRKIMVITGRGLHSADGESKLKKALMKHISKDEPNMRWQRVDDNPGALNVLWTPGA